MLLGILAILIGADLLIRGERSVFSAWWREWWQRQEGYERLLASDVYFYLRSVLFSLFPWLMLWLGLRGWLASIGLTIICASGAVGSLYLWYRFRYRLREWESRYWDALFTGRLDRWIGLGYIVIGVLFIIADLVIPRRG